VEFGGFGELHVPLFTEGAHAASSSAACQEIRVREMAKVCALCAPGFLLGVFFEFGGLFFPLLCVVVIDGGPEEFDAPPPGLKAPHFIDRSVFAGLKTRPPD
jgi:hypothetical protein